MNIGIVSDTHGSRSAWRRIVEGVFRNVDLIIHTGDVLNHGPRNPFPEGYDPDGLSQDLNGCSQAMLFCRGNCDSEVDSMVLDVPLVAPVLFTQLGGLRIWAHHGHLYDEEAMLKSAVRAGAGVCIFGHTHLWKLERSGGSTLMNPGSPALPKGGNPPTVGLIEMSPEKTSLSIVEIATERKLNELVL